MFIGVDIGSTSVRAAAVGSSGQSFQAENSIHYLQDPHDDAYFASSSSEVLEAVLNTLKDVIKQSGNAAVEGICVDATCSMVVQRRVDDGSLVSQGVLSGYDDPKYDLVFWMDHRSRSVLSSPNSAVMAKIGEVFIPEMEIPKIKQIHKDLGQARFKNLVFYDLHDWVEAQLIGEYLDVSTYNDEPVGIDGSVKGFTEEFLRSCDIPIDVSRQVGRGDNLASGTPYAGTPVGHLKKDLAVQLDLPADSTVVIHSGLIDCYASYFVNFHGKTAINPENTMVMVAGTSACILTVSETDRPAPSGIWGGFHVLDNYWFYEGGLSCCGVLLEKLIEQHPESIDDFEKIDEEIGKLVKKESLPTEWDYNAHKFYSGDYFGNRTPYNDASLGACHIGVGLNRDRSDFLSQYLLSLEYIALQTLLIIECFLDAKFPIQNIVVNGSVSKNTRFMQLLQAVLHEDNVDVYIGDTSRYQGAIGSAELCRLGESKDATKEFEKVVAHPKSEHIAALMKVKFDATKEMVEWQQKFHKRIDQVV